MWFLILLTWCNAAFDQKGVVLQNRINLGPLPINLLDGLLALGVLGAIVGPFFSKNRFHTEKAHPVLIATLILFSLAALSGVVGGMMQGANLYGFANDLRNVTSMPLSIFACYYFLKTPQSALRYSYIFIVAGIMSAGLITFFFLGKTAEESLQVEQIRAIQYVSWYAGLAAAVLLFSMLDRHARLLPFPVALMVMGFCLIGQFGTLSRSDWVSALGALFFLPFLLPRKKRALRIVGFAMSVPVIFGILWIGAVIASKITHQELTQKLSHRLTTILPGRGDNAYDSRKAWDTRLPGMKAEFHYFVTSPVIGQGFDYTRHVPTGNDLAFYHNVWISQAALMGIFGFAAYFTPVMAIIVIGRRMVRDAVDKASVIIGVLGATTGVYCLILGASTMSFNIQRGALALGPIVGIVLRTRAMQLQMKREHQYALEYEEAIAYTDVPSEYEYETMQYPAARRHFT
jgi:hypothetical protein